MSKEPPPKNQVLFTFAPFFEKALEVLKPPFMKLLVVLIAAALLVIIFLKENLNSNLTFISFGVVLVLLASLAAFLQYTEIKFRYCRLTEEKLKEALRDLVQEQQEKIAKNVPTKHR